jgi:hypothetical protein
MEYRLEELQQMLLYIEEKLEHQHGYILDDRLQLLTSRNNIELLVKQLEQANGI